MLSQLRRGITWTYASMIISMVIQIGVTATTARLLDPKDFGLIAMANVLLRFGGYVAQMGVGRALIQRPNIDEYDIRAAFTSSTVLGVAVAVIVMLTAPIAAAYYTTPEVVPVIRWLALMFVLAGLGSTAQALLRRNLRFRGSGFVEVAAYTVGYAVPGLWLAASGFGVWSLVAATLGQAAVASGLAYALTRHSAIPTFGLRHHRRLLAFGSKVSAISFLEFLGSTLDSLVIGRFGTVAHLGLYNRAYMLASLPTYHVNNGISKVLFPVLSGGQGDRDAFKATLSRVSEMAVKLVLPVGIGMALAAPELVSVVLGSQWTEAIPLFPVLAAGLAVNLLATFPGIALEALGLLRGKALVQAGFVTLLAGSLVALVLGPGFDLFAVTIVIATAYALRTFALYLLGWHVRVYDSHALLRQLAIAVMCAALSVVMIGGALWLARAGGLAPATRLIVAIVAGGAQLGLLFGRDALCLITGTLGRRQPSEERVIP